MANNVHFNNFIWYASEVHYCITILAKTSHIFRVHDVDFFIFF